MGSVLQSLVKILADTGESDKLIGTGFYFKTENDIGIFTAAHVIKGHDIENLTITKFKNEKDVLDIKPNHAKPGGYDGVLLIFNDVFSLKDFFGDKYLEPYYDYSTDNDKFTLLNAISGNPTTVTGLEPVNKAHYGEIEIRGKKIKGGYSGSPIVLGTNNDPSNRVIGIVTTNNRDSDGKGSSDSNAGFYQSMRDLWPNDNNKKIEVPETIKKTTKDAIEVKKLNSKSKVEIIEQNIDYKKRKTQ